MRPSFDQVSIRIFLYYLIVFSSRILFPYSLSVLSSRTPFPYSLPVLSSRIHSDILYSVTSLHVTLRDQVSRGATGHSMVVRLAYDPRRLPYSELLRVFLTHVLAELAETPRTGNRPGIIVPYHHISISYHHPVCFVSVSAVSASVQTCSVLPLGGTVGRGQGSHSCLHTGAYTHTTRGIIHSFYQCRRNHPSAFYLLAS